MKRFSFLLILSSLLLVTCGGTPMSNVDATPQAAAAIAPTTQPTNTPTPELTATPTLTPPPTETPEPTDTPTPRPTSTSPPTLTPIPTYMLSGTAFFDHNGNGIQDEGEPPIEGAEIGLVRRDRNPDEEKIELSTDTDGAGRYLFADVPTGDYSIDIRSFQRFTHILPSVSEIIPIGDGLRVSVSGDTQVLIPLAEGWMTLPLEIGTTIDVWTYFDLDPGSGIKRYDGRTDYEARIANNHPAIDYRLPNRTPVLAVAPGRVIFTGIDSDDASCPGNITVRILHTVGVKQYETAYNHLSDVADDWPTSIVRGQLIGYSGDSGACSIGSYHLELDLEPWGWEEGPYRFHIDPYRDVTDPQSKNFWTEDNNPHFPP